ncbi:MAG: ribosome recycling factor [Bacteroidota bacterium]
MDDSVQSVIDEAEIGMEASVEHLVTELQKVRAGKASPAMLEGVKVDYYGSIVPVSQVANVSAADARMLTVTPWEKNMIPIIEKAIRDANLGFNPGSDGDMVRVPIPALTEERRKDLVKQAKSIGENTRISIRNVRQSANSSLKKLKDDGTSEDMVKGAESKVQNLTNRFNGKVEDILKVKEKEIMTV